MLAGAGQGAASTLSIGALHSCRPKLSMNASIVASRAAACNISVCVCAAEERTPTNFQPVDKSDLVAANTFNSISTPYDVAYAVGSQVFVYTRADDIANVSAPCQTRLHPWGMFHACTACPAGACNTPLCQDKLVWCCRPSQQAAVSPWWVQAGSGVAVPRPTAHIIPPCIALPGCKGQSCACTQHSLPRGAPLPPSLSFVESCT